MSAAILQFERPFLRQRADGVFAVIYLTAIRMGYPEKKALFAAQQAKRRMLNGTDSAAMVISKTKAVLRDNSEGMQA